MAMIDKILDNVSQAGSYVSVKAKETRTVAKIRAEILKAEKEKKDLLSQIGLGYYEAVKKEEALPSFAPIIAELDGINSKLETLKKELKKYR
ncbi:MAG: hypothetical protein K6A92_00285 [Lachnospiraceae bacterium]|nr:hypothetical protein [Lachnospiraceae bacterium]